MQTKDKPWAERAARLQKGLLRLAFAFYGHNPDLDGQLNALRAQIRNGAGENQLQRSIDGIVNTILTLDTTPVVAAGDPRRQLLLQLLSHLDLPPDCSDELSALRQRLAGNLTESDFKTLMDRCAALLKRIKPGSSPAAPGSAGRELMARLLEGLELPGRMEGELAVLRRRLAHTLEQMELLRLVDDTAAMLTAAARTGDGLREFPSGPLISTVLLRLVERLSLPSAMQEQVQAVKATLSASGGEIEVAAALDGVAGLVRDLQRRLQQEIAELSQFLADVARRLQDLRTHLQQAETLRQASLDDGLHLNREVGCRIQQLRDSVDAASDLASLRSAIRGHLDALDRNMVQFVEAGQQRDQQCRTAARQAEERLRRLESEAERLRDCIRDEHTKALQDALTGLANRLAFEERLQLEHARWLRQGGDLSLMVIDVDDFKRVNDSFGHQAGDRALRFVADLLKGQIRSTDFLARYGGEEFVLILPDTAPEAAAQVAEKLRLRVAECRFHHRDAPVPLTVSCGLAAFSTGDDPESVFNRADQAMYTAKNSGRNRCHLDAGSAALPAPATEHRQHH